jgi:hypothetical protein
MNQNLVYAAVEAAIDKLRPLSCQGELAAALVMAAWQAMRRLGFTSTEFATYAQEMAQAYEDRQQQNRERKLS